MPSDRKLIAESSQRLIAELRQFLDQVEPVASGRPLPAGQWYTELQDTCNQAHYLWSKLEMLERAIRLAQTDDEP